MDEPSRPLLRWHGGKWRLAPWIIAHFPPHRIYTETFGGAASVLLRKPRAYAEVYNDLDEDLVNLFRVVRGILGSPAPSLIDYLIHTPFSRIEFEQAYEHTDDSVERARRLIVRSFMGFGSSGGMGGSTGFRATSNRSGTTPAHDWAHYPDALERIMRRLNGVVIESRDAVTVMQAHDGPETLHYVDPPYVHATRSGGNPYCIKHKYRHELDDAGHARLLGALNDLAGMVVLSGYATPLYDDALRDWRRVETAALADGARARTEVLWLNPTCARALDLRKGGSDSPLFSHSEAAE